MAQKDKTEEWLEYESVPLRDLRSVRAKVRQIGPMKLQFIICPKCERVSYNQKDIEERFCGVCGFHKDLNSDKP